MKEITVSMHNDYLEPDQGNDSSLRPLYHWIVKLGHNGGMVGVFPTANDAKNWLDQQDGIDFSIVAILPVLDVEDYEYLHK